MCQYEVVNILQDCCMPVLQSPLGHEDAERVAAALKALADPARLRLLGLVASSPSGEACVCRLTDPVGLSQPTVSHHLKVLHDAGLLERLPRGSWVYYRLVPEQVEAVRDALRVPETLVAG
jgi:ArsR family transcriptional regulator, arsenate/arsenite/antimonite-responsive transcriptional repressor